jgi:hypothetical protein
LEWADGGLAWALQKSAANDSFVLVAPFLALVAFRSFSIVPELHLLDNCLDKAGDSICPRN